MQILTDGVRQDMPGDDIQAGATQAARGGDIIHLAQGEKGGSHQPGKRHPGKQPDHQGDEHHVIALKISRLHFAQAGAEQDQHQQRWHTQRRIGNAHQGYRSSRQNTRLSHPLRRPWSG